MNRPHQYFKDILLPRGDNFFTRLLLERDREFIGCTTHKKLKSDSQACWCNAQYAITVSNQYEYYEGFATGEDYHVADHAWLVRDGIVYDPTWHGRIKKPEYFGVAIPRVFVLTEVIRQRKHDTLLWRYAECPGQQAAARGAP